MRGGVATAMSIRVAVDGAVMDGVVVNGGNCSIRGELPTVVPSPGTGQIYVKGTEFGDGRQCNRRAGVRQIPCKFHPWWPMCVQERFSSKVPVLLFVRVETAKQAQKIAVRCSLTQIVNSLNVNFKSAATVYALCAAWIAGPLISPRHWHATASPNGGSPCCFSLCRYKYYTDSPQATASLVG